MDKVNYELEKVYFKIDNFFLAAIGYLVPKMLYYNSSFYNNYLIANLFDYFHELLLYT